MEKIPFHSVWFETEIVALEIKGTKVLEALQSNYNYPLNYKCIYQLYIYLFGA